MGLQPGPKYIVLDPEVGRLKSTNWPDEMGVYEIPDPVVLPMPAHTSYQSENGAFLAGALVFGGENQYLAFAAGDFHGFADLKSGEIQVNPPESPRGWFNDWRLLQRGPNEFETILVVTAARPRALKGITSGVPDVRDDIPDDEGRRVEGAREAVRTPAVITKKKDHGRVRGKSRKRGLRA
jgi:hypothetical protein